jgi:hypothetical protein
VATPKSLLWAILIPLKTTKETEGICVTLANTYTTWSRPEVPVFLSCNLEDVSLPCVAQHWLPLSLTPLQDPQVSFKAWWTCTQRLLHISWYDVMFRVCDPTTRLCQVRRLLPSSQVLSPPDINRYKFKHSYPWQFHLVTKLQENETEEWIETDKGAEVTETTTDNTNHWQCYKSRRIKSFWRSWGRGWDCIKGKIFLGILLNNLFKP